MNMNKNNKYKWTGGVVALSLMLSFNACSDDHFDISAEAAGKQTLWQNIQANTELSNYSDILKNVYYSQTEEKQTPETYADIFNGDQVFTVWAPVNGSFDYAYYKGLLDTGERDSIYKVEKELIRNNMTRYSYIFNGSDSVQIALFNDKPAWLNYGNQTIKGVSITTPNIGSSNGVLHITSAPVEYQLNMYEYLASRNDLDSINAFIKSSQKWEFDESSSIQGPMVDGQITWVDSITYLYNEYTSGYMRAYLEREDSSYAMILPTNKAWESMLEKTKKYYHFKDKYKQTIYTQDEDGNDVTIEGKEYSLTQTEIDSLLNRYSKNAICQNLAFNANWQYRQIPINTIENIQAADSLVSTAGIKFKKTGTLNGTNRTNTVEIDDFADMFGNTEPIKVSNGYAYITDEYTYPSTIYAPNINMDAIAAYEFSDSHCNPDTKNWSYESHETITDEEGEVIASRDSTYRYNYFVMGAKSSTSNPGASFQIPNVLSCKYDIYAVIGYNTDYNLQNKFYAYLSYDTENKLEAVTANLTNPNEDAVDATGKSIYGTRYFVNKPKTVNEDLTVNYTDTICLAKDFEFPISYYGAISQEGYHPVLQLKCQMASSDRTYYTREIWVNAIILKPKEN